jgi:hypothetical protein
MLPHKETLVRLLQVQADTVGGALLVDADVQALTRRLQAREA